MVFYNLLLDDPTTKTMICWLDENGNGEDKTLQYGKGNLNYSQTVSSVYDSAESVYIYSTILDNLDPDSTYDIQVDNENTSFKTFPETLLEGRSLKLLVIPDVHIEQDYPANWHDTSHVERFVEEKPDLIIIPGDGTNDDPERGSYLKALRDYFSQFNGEYLTPILWATGNHEAGIFPDPELNNQTLEENRYKDFVPNLSKIEPAIDGYHFGEIVIGDYLQFIVLDSHPLSNTFSMQEQADWIKTLEPKAKDAFVIQHRGYLHNEGKLYYQPYEKQIPFINYVSRNTRDDSGRDDKYQVMMREDWFVELYKLGNVKGFFTGHIHGSYISRPLKPVTYTPDHPFYLLAGKYNLVRDDKNGIREYGQGFRDTDSGIYHMRELPEIVEVGNPLYGYSFYTVDINSENHEIINHSYNVNSGGRRLIWKEGIFDREEKNIPNKKLLLLDGNTN